MTSDDLVQGLRKIVASLTGEPCIAVIAGQGTGSNVNVHLGQRSPRVRALTNPHLTRDERLYEGSLGVFIECSWRLLQSSEFLTGSGDATAQMERMTRQLQALAGRLVSGATLVEPGLDLSLDFEGGLRLEVFCDNGGEDNYSVFNEAGALVVGGGGMLREELD